MQIFKNVLGTVLMTLVQIVHIPFKYLAEFVVMFVRAGISARYGSNRFLMTNQRHGFIHGQSLEPQAHLQIGLMGNGAGHGCGPIAMYNFLLANRDSFGKEYSKFLCASSGDVAIPLIIKMLDRRAGFILKGLAGTNPQVMFSVLRRIAGRNTRLRMDYLPGNTVDHVINHSWTAILLYRSSTGYLHYVMIKKDVKVAPGKYMEFNLYNFQSEMDKPFSVDSVDQWIIQKGRVRTPLALIYVK